MMKKVRRIDYDAPCAFAPLTTDAVVNTDDISRVFPIETRRTEACVRVVFRDGGKMDCVGTVEDFLP